jgi:ferredoxin-NADP reductase/DMSO/TMAO reductase YedYZ heme-binding membrane subunit
MKVTRFSKITVMLNCAVPVILLGWDAWNGNLGANPVNFAILTTGLLTLIFLILTLAITPLSRLARWSWLGQFRRMLGLCAFFHASLHFLLFFGLDRGANVVDTFSEMVKRPYLVVGTLALVLMVPLAVTSTDSMIRRLGGKRWKRLHRLIYVVAAAGALHFYMLVKADVSRPIAFGIAIGILLGYRLLAHYWQLSSDSRKLRSATAVTLDSHRVAAPGAKPRFWKGQMKVARVFEETPEVRTFRLVPTTTSWLPFDFLPGQYLNLSLSIDGKKVNRSYTIASSPTRVGYCELTVKREGHGVASRYLHNAVREGNLVDVSAPAGRFTFTGVEAQVIVMVAGGVGITPLMSKIRYLTDLGWPGEIYLLYTVKTEGDIIFREELEYLRRRFSNLRVTITLSRDSGSSWQGERGRITPELLNRLVPRLSSHRVHICGPVQMMDSVGEMLRGLGVPAGQIQRESFTRGAGTDSRATEATALEYSGTLGTPNGADHTASITFARAGKSKPLSARQTVLEASEELGVDIPYDCRAGICGQCKTRLLSGRVVMDVEDALDPLDRTSGLILSCQARCVDHVVVEA